jgi:hypothetical protein
MSHDPGHPEAVGPRPEQVTLSSGRPILVVPYAGRFVDRCPLGQTQHRNHHLLLGGGLRVGLRLGVRQGLDCRPQLIDQRVAVANFLSLFDIGQPGRALASAALGASLTRGGAARVLVRTWDTVKLAAFKWTLRS